MKVEIAVLTEAADGLRDWLRRLDDAGVGKFAALHLQMAIDLLENEAKDHNCVKTQTDE